MWIAGIRVCILVRNIGVVDIVMKCCVLIPQAVAPFLLRAVRIQAAPPLTVPVQPVRGHTIRIEEDVIYKTCRAELSINIIVVCLHGHVIGQDVIF